MAEDTRPRLWLTDSEIAALPDETIIWRNVAGSVVWGGVFATKEDAAHAAACSRRDTGGRGFGKPTSLRAADLRVE